MTAPRSCGRGTSVCRARSGPSTGSRSAPRRRCRLRGFDAFEPDAAMDDDGNVFTVWTIDVNPDPQSDRPQIQFSFRPAEDAYHRAGPDLDPWSARVPTADRDRRAEQRPGGLGRGRRRRHGPGPSRIPAGRVGAGVPAVVDPVAGRRRRLRAAGRVRRARQRAGRLGARRPGGRRGLAGRVARSGPGAAASERRGLVSSGADGVAAFGVRLAIDESATAVWSEFEGFSLRAMAAFRPKGGGFGSTGDPVDGRQGRVRA